MGYTKENYSITLRDVAVKSQRRLPVKKSEEVKIFQKIFNEFLSKVVDKAIEDGYCFDLPYQMGRLFLRSEYKTDAINISETIKEKKRIYYSNIASLGYVFKLRWQVYDEFPHRDLCSYLKNRSLSKYVGEKILNLIKNRKLPVAFEELKNMENRKNANNIRYNR